jgi:hypothetical protein
MTLGRAWGSLSFGILIMGGVVNPLVTIKPRETIREDLKGDFYII